MFKKKIDNAIYLNWLIFFMVPAKNKIVASNKGTAKAL